MHTSKRNQHIVKFLPVLFLFYDLHKYSSYGRDLFQQEKITFAQFMKMLFDCLLLWVEANCYFTSILLILSQKENYISIR